MTSIVNRWWRRKTRNLVCDVSKASCYNEMSCFLFFRALLTSLVEDTFHRINSTVKCISRRIYAVLTRTLIGREIVQEFLLLFLALYHPWTFWSLRVFQFRPFRIFLVILIFCRKTKRCFFSFLFFRGVHRIFCKIWRKSSENFEK